MDELSTAKAAAQIDLFLHMNGGTQRLARWTAKYVIGSMFIP